MVEKRFHPPPKPSLPREAPWREIEELIDEMKVLVSKVDELISLYTGGAPPIPSPPAIPSPPELASVNSRLDAIIAARVKNKATFSTGQRDVETIGEPEQLDDFPVPDGFQLTVIAKTGNTGYIYLGKNASDCVNNKRKFDGLGAGLAHSFRVKNANAIWVDSSVQGTSAAPEGVSWSVETDV